MDAGILTQYIVENCLVLLPVLWLLGAIFKGTPKLPDWLIPYLLTIFGVMGACCLVGFTMEGVVQGVLAAGVAVLGHQLLHQAKNKE